MKSKKKEIWHDLFTEKLAFFNARRKRRKEKEFSRFPLFFSPFCSYFPFHALFGSEFEQKTMTETESVERFGAWGL